MMKTENPTSVHNKMVTIPEAYYDADDPSLHTPLLLQKVSKDQTKHHRSARAALIAIMPSAVTHMVREMDLLHQVFRPAALQQKMMSWAAFRSGVGGVAAGGWLATLQSIGASGLGFQGTYRLKCQCCHDVFSTKENTTQVLPGSSSEVQAKRALKFQRNVF
jgi:hypothetical protein